MTNTKILVASIQKAGLKYKFIAEKLGITPYGLYKKMKNKTEFKASEISTLSELLLLPDEVRNMIFFAKSSDL